MDLQKSCKDSLISKNELKTISEEQINFRDLGACGEGFDTAVTLECPCGKGSIVQIYYLGRISDARTEILCEECNENYEVVDPKHYNWSLRKTN